MSISRRKLLQSAAVIGLAAGFQSTSIGVSFAETPKRGGVLTMLMSSEPHLLTSAFETSNTVGMASTKIFDGLVRFDKNLQPTPALAESWDISPDGKRIVFTLRKGVKWHDGADFTSADVAFSMMKVWKERHSRGKSTYANVVSVEEADAHTLIVNLSNPTPYMIGAMTSYESQVIPKHIYDGTDIATNPANLNPIGTGPFKFGEWQKGSHIILERNDEYWEDGKPYLDRLILRFIADTGSRSAAFEAGEADIGFFSPVEPHEVERISSLPNLDTVTNGYEAIAAMHLMELNMRRKEFQDIRVRQAMLHAIDREFIRDNIFFGIAKVATGPLPSTSPLYEPDTAQYPYDPALANKLLDEAGYPRGADGFRFKMTHDPTPFLAAYLVTADYVKQALAEVGIDVQVRRQDLASQIKTIYTDINFDMSGHPLNSTFDPQVGVARLFWSKNIRPGVPFSNVTPYDDPAIDAAIEQSLVEVDPVKRKEQWSVVQKLAQEKLQILYLLEARYFTIFNTSVHDHTLGADAPFSSLAGAYKIG